MKRVRNAALFSAFVGAVLISTLAASGFFNGPIGLGPRPGGFGIQPTPFSYQQYMTPYTVAPQAQVYSGSDCQADRTEGDLYPEPDFFCIVQQGIIAVTQFVEREAATDPAPTNTPDATNTPKPELTPSPTQTPKPELTPGPTATPKPELTPEPEATKRPNKGGGNGCEGADPGKHPEKGNDDEQCE